tara:strand:+ start:8298 stop:9374 length:1077 start_codon:yes stop_codon:yes gene_type:complete
MTKKIKILFFIPNLMAGGAERVISFLTNNLDTNTFDCILIIIGKEKDIAYNIQKSNVRFLNEDRVLHSIPKLIKTIRGEKPDIVISTVSHLNIAIAVSSIFFRKSIYIARQAAITKVSFNIKTKAKKSWTPDLLGIALRKMDYVICQSKDMAVDCVKEFSVEKNNIKIIQNPITDDFKIKHQEKLKTDIYKFISVGRLVEIKGHLRIIRILSQIKIPFIYTIIGDGPLKDDIFNKIKEVGLSQFVKHIPYSNKIADYLSENDFFIQGSLSEGFPNALLESCAVGTPAIAFDSPGGTKEIIENGVNGFLVDTEEEFIDRLNNLPHFDSKSVSDSVFKKFDKKIILNEYEEFFKEIVKKN